MTMVNVNIPRREKVAVFQNAVTVMRGITKGSVCVCTKKATTEDAKYGPSNSRSSQPCSQIDFTRRKYSWDTVGPSRKSNLTSE
jgi:hypothetical protein